MGMDQYIYAIFPHRAATALNSHTDLDQRHYLEQFRKDYDMHRAILPFYIRACEEIGGETLTEQDVMNDAYMGMRLTPEILDAIAEHRPTPCDMELDPSECIGCIKDRMVADAVEMARQAMAQDMMVYYSADW